MTSSRGVRRGQWILAQAVVLAGLLGTGAATWVRASLVTGQDVTADGFTAVPSLISLVLAGFALLGVMSLAGPWGIRVLAVLGLADAGALAWLVARVLTDPIDAIASVVSEHTGVAGEASIALQVSKVSPSAVPVLIALGLLLVLAASSVYGMIRAGSWPATRRFRAQGAGRPPGAALDRQDAWDSLSEGDDPTAQGDAKLDAW